VVALIIITVFGNYCLCIRFVYVDFISLLNIFGVMSHSC
jgi:hypothetical protein